MWYKHSFGVSLSLNPLHRSFTIQNLQRACEYRLHNGCVHSVHSKYCQMSERGRTLIRRCVVHVTSYGLLSLRKIKNFLAWTSTVDNIFHQQSVFLWENNHRTLSVWSSRLHINCLNVKSVGNISSSWYFASIYSLPSFCFEKSYGVKKCQQLLRVAIVMWRMIAKKYYGRPWRST